MEVKKEDSSSFFFNTYYLLVIIINNFFRYFYGFDNYKLVVKKNKNYLIFLDRLFLIEEVTDTKSVLDIYKLLKDDNYYYNFVLNINNSIFSEFNGRQLVLLEIKPCVFGEFYLSHNNHQLEGSIELQWRTFWIDIYDYVVQVYKLIVGKYDVIDDSIYYYLGMLQTAICYLNDFKDYVGMKFLEHKVIDDIDVHNPLNVIFDIRERDFGEYLKFLFLNRDYSDSDLDLLFFSNKDLYNFNLVFSRLLYPNFYFKYLLDTNIDSLCDSDLNSINKLIARSNDYEKFLKTVFSLMDKYQKLKKIDWI